MAVVSNTSPLNYLVLIGEIEILPALHHHVVIPVAVSERGFAIGQAGAFTTRNGVKWTRLLDTGSLPCRPMNCYYDWIGTPGGALYVSMSVRDLVKISPLETITLVAVPNVVNSPATVAATEITAAHLVPKFAGTNQKGSWVFSQSPAAGQQVLPGATVTMVLHTGPIP